MREFLIAKAKSLLEAKGFEVTSFASTHTCFDLAARKDGLMLLLKIFDNVDALHEEHSLELKKLVRLFNAVVIILGAKTKSFSLRKGVIYERYGLPVISIDSLRDILEEKMPGIKSFKGKEIVELNAEKMRRRRKELGLTLGEVASKIDSTVESIHRYEKGHATSLNVAERLEKVLNTKLVNKIDLFEQPQPEVGNIFEEYISDKALEKVHDLGLELALFEHAPFRAGSHPSEGLVISKGSSDQEVKRKAIALQKTSVAFDAHGMLIASKTKLRAVQHIPVVEEQELTTLDKFKDLMKLLRERERAEGNE